MIRSVTGRPRRTGWFDLPGFKYAARVNGLDGFALTKLDVLTGLGTLRVCVGYDTPEGRARNRRVTLMILEDLTNAQGAAAAPSL